jgi:hypothetical protein
MLKRSVKVGIISEAVYKNYLSRTITLDFQLFAPAIAETNLTFFATFKLATSELLKDADDEVWANASGKYKDIVLEAMSGSRASTMRRLQS